MEVATWERYNYRLLKQERLQPLFHVNMFKEQLEACGAAPVCRAGV